jgi:hypothetical protein
VVQDNPTNSNDSSSSPLPFPSDFGSSGVLADFGIPGFALLPLPPRQASQDSESIAEKQDQPATCQTFWSRFRSDNSAL